MLVRLLVLQSPDARYLGPDYETFVDALSDAARFYPGAAVNSLWEEFRGRGVTVREIRAEFFILDRLLRSGRLAADEQVAVTSVLGMPWMVEKSDDGFDPVERPKGYNSHPSGIQCIEVNELYPANIAAAIKYVWRDGIKEVPPLQDLRKAEWYLKREVEPKGLPIHHREKVDAVMKTEGLLSSVLGALSGAPVSYHPFSKQIRRALDIVQLHIVGLGGSVRK